LLRFELPKESEVNALCAKAKEVLVEEANVQKIDAPVTVIFFFYSKKRYVGISMGSLRIFRSYSRSGASARRSIIYF
jgi:hypothetical protein